MNLKNVLLTSIAATSLLATSCDEDDASTPTNPDSSESKVTITGGPYEFTVDGKEDKITEGDIKVTKEGKVNSKAGWIVTDADGKILGLPPMPSAVNFDDAGLGKCLVWYIGYEEGLEGLEAGKNANDLKGTFTLSNSITVDRVAPEGAAALSGGPFEFIVDLKEDRLADDAITVDKTNAIGENTGWVVTDLDGKILGLPPVLSGPEFNEAGVGTCLIWYISYDDGLMGLEGGKNTADLSGAKFYLSNPIKVDRKAPEGGAILSGGPFTIKTTEKLAEGSITADTSNKKGSLSGWVVTDETGETILGLPGKPSDVDFSGAGVGTCYIWYVNYDEGVTGIEGMAKIADIDGTVYFSNPIKVVREAANMAMIK